MEHYFSVLIPEKVYKQLIKHSIQIGSRPRMLVRYWMAQFLLDIHRAKYIKETDVNWIIDKTCKKFTCRVIAETAITLAKLSRDYKKSISEIVRICIYRNLQAH